MLDDAFRKNNLLEEKDWNEVEVMEDVKSVVGLMIVLVHFLSIIKLL